MSRFSHLLIAAAAASLLTAPSAYAQTKLTSEMAMAAVKAVQAYARNDGSDPSTAVVDTNGDVVLLLKGNNAAPHNVGLAERKAFTANTFKMKSIEWRDVSMPGKDRASERQMRTVDAIPAAESSRTNIPTTHSLIKCGVSASNATLRPGSWT